MGITVIKIVLGMHANQDSQCSIIKNVGKIAKVIRLGLVLITVVDVKLINLFKMECALTAMQHVGHAAILPRHDASRLQSEDAFSQTRTGGG